METICRADLPGATLPLKAVILLAARGGGRWRCRTTPAWQVPPLLATPSRSDLWSYQGEIHSRVKTLLVLPRPDGSRGAFGGVQEFGCATRVVCLHPFSSQQSGDSSVPSRSSVHLSGGKGSSGGGGCEVQKMFLPGRRIRMCCYRWLSTQARGCRRMHRDKGGCRDEKDYEKLVTKRWQV